jgi:hypothetical protein
MQPIFGDSDMGHRLSADPDRKWAVEVGRFILAFGDIEHTSVACLAGIPTESLGKVSTKMALGLRLEVLVAVLSSKQAADYKSLATVVAAVKRFVDKRNLVAHNPVQFSFYQKTGEGVSIQPELVSTRDRTKRLTFSQLVALADEAERLADAFTEASMVVFERYHLSESDD